MPRKTSEELECIKEQLKITNLWSWSRFHSYCQDKWSYFLKYVLHIKEDKNDGIYTYSGSVCHDLLEQYENGKINQQEMFNKVTPTNFTSAAQMFNKYEESLLVMASANLKYDRNDSDKNDKIANKYETCLKHFFLHHNKPNYQMLTEPFILIHIAEDIYFQGYIDNLILYRDKKNEIHAIITDYKTSTIYKGDKLKKESGQLYLYAEGIMQRLSIPISHITVRYLFMKYVTVHCLQVNQVWNTRQIERCLLGEKLTASVKMWLKKSGYSADEIENYINDLLLSNSIDSLPKNIQEKFIIEDCYLEIPLNQGIIDNLKSNICDIISDIQSKTQEYQLTQDERIWWQTVTPQDEYYHAVLSGYSRHLHKPYDEYLKEKELFLDTNQEDFDALLEVINNEI